MPGAYKRLIYTFIPLHLKYYTFTGITSDLGLRKVRKQTHSILGFEAAIESFNEKKAYKV